jgi:hypothetical protein
MESEIGQDLEKTEQKEDSLLKLSRLASAAKREIENIRFSKKEKQTTTAVVELASWLGENAGDSETSLQKIVNALKAAHFWMDDERKVDINDKINDVVWLMFKLNKQDKSGANEFRTEFHTIIDQLETFCEALE